MLEQLPSEAAARALVRGEPGAWVDVLSSTLLRASLIGAGLYVVGSRERLVRNALAGALAVEIGVLLFAWNTEPAT